MGLAAEQSVGPGHVEGGARCGNEHVQPSWLALPSAVFQTLWIWLTKCVSTPRRLQLESLLLFRLLLPPCQLPTPLNNNLRVVTLNYNRCTLSPLFHAFCALADVTLGTCQRLPQTLLLADKLCLLHQSLPRYGARASTDQRPPVCVLKLLERRNLYARKGLDAVSG